MKIKGDNYLILSHTKLYRIFMIKIKLFLRRGRRRTLFYKNSLHYESQALRHPVFFWGGWMLSII